MARQQVSRPAEPGEKYGGATRVQQITKQRRGVIEALGSRVGVASLYLPLVPMVKMAVPKVPEVDSSEQQRRKTPQGANSETRQIEAFYIHRDLSLSGCKVSHNRSTSSGWSNRTAKSRMYLRESRRRASFNNTSDSPGSFRNRSAPS